MKTPLISVVIPSYNKGEYVEETLQSIFDQTYKNFEVIIQDGKSTDETIQIIEKFVKKYPKKINFESKKDKGQLDAINKGLKKAKGEIVTYINADDVYERKAFELVAEDYTKNTESLWFAGKGMVIDGKGKELAKLVTAYKNLLLSLNNRNFLLITNYLMQPSVFLSRKAYKKYGPFTGTKDFVMEYDMWLKVSKDQMPVLTKKNLSKFRLEPGTISSRMSKKLLDEDEKVVKKYTKIKLILALHKLHNLFRILLGKFV